MRHFSVSSLYVAMPLSMKTNAQSEMIQCNYNQMTTQSL